MKLKYLILKPVRKVISSVEPGFQVYLFLVDIIDKASFKRFPKAIAKLMEIPGRQKITVLLHGKYYSFRYYSEPNDQLNISCRNNLLQWEPKSRAIWSILSINSKNIMDIGAYTGVYALTAASSNSNAIIYAIEPNKDMAQQILKNIEINYLNSNIEVHNYALWKKNTVLKFYSYKDSSKNSLFSKDAEPESFREIEAFAIDSRSEYKNVDLIEGARNLLRSNSPIILMEALTIEELGAQQKILKEFSYLDPIQVSESGSDKRNYLWTTSENLKKVQESLDKVDLITTQS
jgi:FkbM family methyltransferase